MSPVTKISSVIPVTDELIVDHGFGTGEQQRAAAVRLFLRREAWLAHWRALPWHVRAARTVRLRTYEPMRRIALAIAVLRGVDDRD